MKEIPICAEIGPWEAVWALVAAADEAAEWISTTRQLAKELGTLDSLSHGRRPLGAIAPGQRGAPEVKKLRAAIRKARAALSRAQVQP